MVGPPRDAPLCEIGDAQRKERLGLKSAIHLSLVEGGLVRAIREIRNAFGKIDSAKEPRAALAAMHNLCLFLNDSGSRMRSPSSFPR